MTNNIRLSIFDAANNSADYGSKTVLTLHSGVRYTGRIDKSLSLYDTVHLSLAAGGWVAINLDDIAAVESRRPAPEEGI